MLTAVVGLNWGDEGKGKVVDRLAAGADLVVRFQGGNNAGHTIVTDQGTFKLHLVPSGVFQPQTTNLLGPGCVVNLEAFAGELDELERAGVDTSRVLVSERAAVVFDFHRWFDIAEEERLGARQYGSTRRGIAPAYGDRAMKKTLLVGELFDDKHLAERLELIAGWADLRARTLYDGPGVLVDEVHEWIREFREPLRGRVVDTGRLLREAAREDRQVLFEAQLGAMRDLIYGIYPYTTSSNCLAAYASLGGGAPELQLDQVVGVVKAYASCVGAGPFVTEFGPEVADPLRERWGEFGAATGRPRRLGHFDAFATRYGATIQGATALALTNLDQLSGTGPLQVCVGYRIDGRDLDTFPVGDLHRVEPVYEQAGGWDDDLTGIRRYEDLPAPARGYVEAVEHHVGVPVDLVSVGPHRDQTVVR
ncbi:MAG TPA: adenylosuccinate synthase [Nitriliruptorales bacterium]